MNINLILLIYIFLILTKSAVVTDKFKQDFNSISDPDFWDLNSPLTDECKSQNIFTYTFNGITDLYTAVGCGCNMVIIRTNSGDIIKAWRYFHYTDTIAYVYDIKFMTFYNDQLILFTDNRLLTISDMDLIPDYIAQINDGGEPYMTQYQYNVIDTNLVLSSILHFKDNGGNLSQYIILNRQNMSNKYTTILNLSDFNFSESNLSPQKHMYQINNDGFIIGTYINNFYIWNFNDFDVNFQYDNSNKLSIYTEPTGVWENIINFTQENTFCSFNDLNEIALFKYSQDLQQSNTNSIQKLKVYDTSENLKYISLAHDYQISFGNDDGKIYHYNFQDWDNSFKIDDDSIDNYNIYNIQKVQDWNYGSAIGGKHTIIIYIICENECKECNINQCNECIDENKPNNNCKCQSQYFLDFGEDECTQCVSSCKECVTTNNKCTQCFNGTGLNTTNNTCSVTCDSQCETCENTSSNCTSCSNNQMGLPDCLECQEGQYYDSGSNQCETCHVLCDQCTGSANNCQSCQNGAILDNNTCQCDTNQYFDSNQCQDCHVLCNQCTGSATNCQSCQNGAILDNNNCLCDTNYYFDSIQCQQCQSQCSSCDTTSSNCLSCSDVNMDLSSLCTSCQQNYYLDTNLNSCQQCDSNCLNCAQSSIICTECYSEYELNTENQSCIQINNELIQEEEEIEQNEDKQFQQQQQPEETQAEIASKEATKTIENSQQAVVSSFFLLALLGYFYMLISVIDYSQFLFMLMFIDIQYKPNLLEFFRVLFEFQIPFIPNIFKGWAYDEEKTRAIDAAPNNFVRNEYYSFFLENFGICLSTILLPSVFLLIFYILGFKTKNTKFKYLNVIRVYIQKIFLMMRYSSVIDMALMEFINIPAACLMQFYQLKIFESNFQTYFTYLLWILTTLGSIVIPIYFHIKTALYVKNRNEKFREKFGHLWGGCKIDSHSSICYIFILQYRKIIFTIIVILFYKYPYFQLIALMVLQCLLIIYMLFFRPFVQKWTLLINVLTESVYIMCLVIIYISCPDQKCTNNGSVIIFSSIGIVLLNIIYTIIQICIEKYKKIKLKKLERKQGDRRIQVDQDKAQKDIQNILDNKQNNNVEVKNEFQNNKVVPENVILSDGESIKIQSPSNQLQNQYEQLFSERQIMINQQSNNNSPLSIQPLVEKFKFQQLNINSEKGSNSQISQNDNKMLSTTGFQGEKIQSDLNLSINSQGQSKRQRKRNLKNKTFKKDQQQFYTQNLIPDKFNVINQDNQQLNNFFNTDDDNNNNLQSEISEKEETQIRQKSISLNPKIQIRSSIENDIKQQKQSNFRKYRSRQQMNLSQV